MCYISCTMYHSFFFFAPKLDSLTYKVACLEIVKCLSVYPSNGFKHIQKILKQKRSGKRWITELVLPEQQKAIAKAVLRNRRKSKTWRENGKRKRNKWHGVTISLRTGEQGHPTLIHTHTQYPNISKKYQKRSFSKFSTRWPRTDGPTERRTDGQSLL